MTKRATGQKLTDEFGLSRDPISLEDTISPAFFAREMEAVFRPSWLYVGRLESIPSPGAYFTKEFEPLKASILVTRDKEHNVRAFYNVCPHRGNKLVWETHANREVSGRCSRFVCKLHGIAFGPSGNMEFLSDKTAWFEGQGEALHLAEVPSDTWNGFIFVNLRQGGPNQSLREFIGEDYWTGFDYPFDEMTEHFAFRANAEANWKSLMDGFSEVYHAATTHALPFATPPLDQIQPGARHFRDVAIRGRHRYYLTGGKPRVNFPYERETNAQATGPLYKFPAKYAELPPMANPIGLTGWGTSSHMFWPNLYIQFYHPGWFLTYVMKPLAHNKMRFELDIYMPRPNDFSEMLAQKSTVLQFVEAALQDFSLLEAQQLGLEMRAFDSYPLTDQEILLRDFHGKISAAVSSYAHDSSST